MTLVNGPSYPSNLLRPLPSEPRQSEGKKVVLRRLISIYLQVLPTRPCSHPRRRHLRSAHFPPTSQGVSIDFHPIPDEPFVLTCEVTSTAASLTPVNDEVVVVYLLRVRRDYRCLASAFRPLDSGRYLTIIFFSFSFSFFRLPLVRDVAQ